MLWRGIAIGVIISAPMGPVGILCVQRTLQKGRRTGFFTGIGAALSDLFYCLVTGFGLSFIEEFLKANQNVIQIIGSVVLVLFGIYLFRSNPSRSLKKPEESQSSRGRDILQGFLFTFSNPLIIFLIIGLFARFNFLLPEITLAHYLVGYVFIFIGALLWWWLVSYFVDKVRGHFNLRSMWLINRITGGIILIFAVVGVITAISGMASAASYAPRDLSSGLYLNSTRGFGSLGDSVEPGKPLTLDNTTADTLCRSIPLNGASALRVSLRLANLHDEPGKSYRYHTPSGSSRVSHPAWGLGLFSEGRNLRFEIRGTGDSHDDIYQAAVSFKAFLDGIPAGETVMTSGLGEPGSVNSYRMVLDNGVCTLLAGDRTYAKVLSVEVPGLRPDSILFYVNPGGHVALDHVAVEAGVSGMALSDGPFSHFSDPDVRTSYFSRSTDKMEGVWQIFDRALDDSRLRQGGEYTVAVVASTSGYELIYLDGAVKNASAWRPGMTKGSLVKTRFPGVFNLSWLDPAGVPLRGEAKAQFSGDGMLTLQFVEHESQLRLRKIPAYDK